MDDAGHLPVLLSEVRELLSPALIGGGMSAPVLVDCTVGLGGHAEALLESAEAGTILIGIDLDESNLLKTKERLARFGPRVRLFSANFADVDQVLAEAGLAQAGALLADLGVSSVHLDDPERGFSFQVDGPLDMRLKQAGKTAAELVNSLVENELADVIYRYGEERFSRRIARAIVEARRRERIQRTGQLAEIVARSVPRSPGDRGRIHPATRTFMALRIAVNRELDNLEQLLSKLPRLLGVGGRAAVISFHSLEDRRVKQSLAALAEAGAHKLLTRKPLMAQADEMQRNPRSRSARLRAIERIR